MHITKAGKNSISGGVERSPRQERTGIQRKRIPQSNAAALGVSGIGHGNSPFIKMSCFTGQDINLWNYSISVPFLSTPAEECVDSKQKNVLTAAEECVDSGLWKALPEKFRFRLSVHKTSDREIGDLVES